MKHGLEAHATSSPVHVDRDSQKSKRRVDGQVTGLAGEFFVAAELLKRNLQTSITFHRALL